MNRSVVASSESVVNQNYINQKLVELGLRYLFLVVFASCFCLIAANAGAEDKPAAGAGAEKAASGHGEDASKPAKDLENTIYLDLKDGRVEIELFPDVAPKHVARIKELAREKFYDGLVFHRVIDGFMVQTGDPTGTGMGGSNKPNLPAEFSSTPHDRGVVSMARANDPGSANSQFFIMLKDTHSLDGKYSAWGRVTTGIEFVDKIKKGDIRKNGTVENPDKIVRMRVAADAE